MTSVDADPLDGPEIDTSDPVGSLKGAGMYIVGAGVFFALLAAAQQTVTPMVQSGLDMVPFIQSGGSGSGMVRFGNPED